MPVRVRDPKTARHSQAFGHVVYEEQPFLKILETERREVFAVEDLV